MARFVAICHNVSLMSTKRKQWKGDRSKEKVVEVPRRAAAVLKRRQDDIDRRKVRDRKA
jgi:hypothetical protein